MIVVRNMSMLYAPPSLYSDPDGQPLSVQAQRLAYIKFPVLEHNEPSLQVQRPQPKSNRLAPDTFEANNQMALNVDRMTNQQKLNCKRIVLLFVLKFGL